MGAQQRDDESHTIPKLAVQLCVKKKFQKLGTNKFAFTKQNNSGIGGNSGREFSKLKWRQFNFFLLERIDMMTVGAGLTDGCPVSVTYLYIYSARLSFEKTNDAHPSLFPADFWLYIVPILFRINVVHTPPCPLLLGPRAAEKKNTIS
jgi:hypothetical protein